MGERAFSSVATGDDLRSMERELCASLRAGAYGFSTSITRQHETSDNRPVASRLATWEEVCRLVLTMGDQGVGIFQFVEDPPEGPERVERDDQILNLAIEARIPFAIPAPASTTRPIELLETAAATGSRIFGLTHCRGSGTLSSFRSRLPFDCLPEWREIRALPLDHLRVALRDAEVRNRLVHTAHNGEYGRAIGAEPRAPDFHRMQVMDRPVPPYRSLSEVACERGVDPVEALIDLALETDFNQLYAQSFTETDDAALQRVLKHPRTVLGFSDAGAHVSQMSDSSLYTYFLAYWFRHRQAFSLEEAVRMLTFSPARAWGFHERGLLREGLVADINVFDPDRVSPDMPVIVHDLPGGGPRFKQTATGILATIVSGEIVHLRGEHTGALPGRLLRGPLAGRRLREGENRDP
jgi:N-acyl-D-aspartate/D-glutamate deacylase